SRLQLTLGHGGERQAVPVAPANRSEQTPRTLRVPPRSNIKERTMTDIRTQPTAIETPKAPTVDLKLEIAVIPVSDVDRAKAFYANLGWRLDADFAAGDDWRVIQFPPPGSPPSLLF